MGLRQLAAYDAKYNYGAEGPFQSAGAPTNNVTYLGRAQVGSLLTDNVNGKLYICTATNGTSTITWTVVGAQT
jgi:hypothetical protein